MRLAAIDIGSNSIHMVIAEASRRQGFDIIDREREVVQVGRGSFGSKWLRRDAIRRTTDSLGRFVELARRHQVDRILCTATAAVREARNGAEFLRAARRAAGITPRVITPTEEGRLIYLGIRSALELGEGPCVIVDIGGGSMQLVLASRERLHLTLSAPLGALRLTESLLRSDPPSRRDLERLSRHVRKTVAEPLARLRKARPLRAYGSSGSIHALANVAHALESSTPLAHINGHVLTLESLRRVTRQLQAMTLREREHLPGLDAHRAEIIVAGAVALQHVLERLRLPGITLSDFGVREGLVNDYVTRHAGEISSIAMNRNLRLRSVLSCVRRFRLDVRHAKHVARLSLELFDALRKVHKLGPPERELLHFAALLHDIGSVIAYDGHAEHSHYIIMNASLRGLSAEELRVIANVARYHNKARPRKRDQDFYDLDKRQRRIVRWLAALLRVAEGLDRSHDLLVPSVSVAKNSHGIEIRARSRGEAQLELWAARRRADMLKKLLGGPVQVTGAEDAKDADVA
jgi:exopolyphosphatase/guanosine-5'-triphosphate,3'-diphosphate pyrophosphatase